MLIHSILKISELQIFNDNFFLHLWCRFCFIMLHEDNVAFKIDSIVVALSLAISLPEGWPLILFHFIGGTSKFISINI